MAWTYKQVSGSLVDSAGALVATGYSGFGSGKNNPAMQSVHGVGPIPQGQYLIEPPRDSATHGPFVLPLKPYDSNTMFGRGGFLIHGDSLEHPGSASEGCIILPRSIREQIALSGDNQLFVVQD